MQAQAPAAYEYPAATAAPTLTPQQQLPHHFDRLAHHRPSLPPHEQGASWRDAVPGLHGGHHGAPASPHAPAATAVAATMADLLHLPAAPSPVTPAGADAHRRYASSALLMDSLDERVPLTDSQRAMFVQQLCFLRTYDKAVDQAFDRLEQACGGLWGVFNSDIFDEISLLQGGTASPDSEQHVLEAPLDLPSYESTAHPVYNRGFQCADADFSTARHLSYDAYASPASGNALGLPPASPSSHPPQFAPHSSLMGTGVISGTAAAASASGFGSPGALSSDIQPLPLLGHMRQFPSPGSGQSALPTSSLGRPQPTTWQGRPQGPPESGMLGSALSMSISNVVD
jgi:hypothetical protein